MTSNRRRRMRKLIADALQYERLAKCRREKSALRVVKSLISTTASRNRRYGRNGITDWYYFGHDLVTSEASLRRIYARAFDETPAIMARLVSEIFHAWRGEKLKHVHAVIFRCGGVK